MTAVDPATYDPNPPSFFDRLMGTISGVGSTLLGYADQGLKSSEKFLEGLNNRLVPLTKQIEQLATVVEAGALAAYGVHPSSKAVKIFTTAEAVRTGASDARSVSESVIQSMHNPDILTEATVKGRERYRKDVENAERRAAERKRQEELKKKKKKRGSKNSRSQLRTSRSASRRDEPTQVY
jgi:hypothetical protein